VSTSDDALNLSEESGVSLNRARCIDLQCVHVCVCVRLRKIEHEKDGEEKRRETNETSWGALADLEEAREISLKQCLPFSMKHLPPHTHCADRQDARTISATVAAAAHTLLPSVHA
jgi:hypothetical protein